MSELSADDAYLAWVEGIHEPDPREPGSGFVVLDMLHPEDVSSIHAGSLNFRSLVESDFKEGLKTLPLVLPYDQMTPAWRSAVRRASSGRRKLYVWLRPDRKDGGSELAREGLGRAVLALSGWDDDGGPGEAIFIERIVAAGRAASRRVDAALSTTAFVSNLPAPKSFSGHSTVTKRRFLRDVLEHPTWGIHSLSVGVYDVGQGSASALVDDAEHPRVFFDVGKPIWPFNYTRPKHLPDFFHCDATKGSTYGDWCNAPVILSHWDFDHWAGVLKSAYVYKVNGKKTAKLTLVPHALERYWIVPNQEHLNLGPTHVELIRQLAKSVNPLTNMTALQYWPKTLSQVRFTHGVVVKAVPDPGAGTSTAAQRNNSGLVLMLTRPQVPQSADSGWILLPGDARRESIPVDLDAMSLIGMVVSHHGGVNGSVPAAAPWPGATSLNPNIVCSVGQAKPSGEKPYGHPDPVALSTHQARGWDSVTFTFNKMTPASSSKSLGNYCLSFDSSQPRCDCDCIGSSNLSLNRIPNT